MATGLLVLLVGRATRLTPYVPGDPKVYTASVLLGRETDTFDLQGNVLSENGYGGGVEEVEKAMEGLIGEWEQVPPAFSAVQKDGVRAYTLARRGVTVERTPRAIEIFALTVRAIALPDVEFDAHCSKGTYIRSLAHDLGERLGCGACLTALTRLASGSFTLDDALTLDQLRDAFAQNSVEHFLYPLDEALLQFQAVTVNAENAQRIQRGNSVFCERADTTPLLRAYAPNGECIALLERGRQAGEWKPHKVFLSDL